MHRGHPTRRCALRAFAAMFAAWGFLLAGSFPALAQRVILFEKFENDTPDALPASADHYARSSTNPDPMLDPSKVVVTGGTFADPFAAGNHSMLLYNPQSTTQQGIGWSSEFPDDPSQLKNAVIEFDLWLDPAVDGVSFWSYLDLRIGHNNPGVDKGLPQMLVIPADGTAWNSFREQVPNNNMFTDGEFWYFGNTITFNDASQMIIKSGEAMHVRYDFNAATAKYQVKIDDTTITWGDGQQDRPWLWVGDPSTPAPGINELAFFTAAINPTLGATGNVYIDNITVTNLDLAPLTPNADVNGDGFVDIFDVNLVSANWANMGAPGIPGDANVDGMVDIFDVNLISANWSPPPAPGGGAAVPEPSSAVLIALAAVGLVWRMARRRGLTE